MSTHPTTLASPTPTPWWAALALRREVWGGLTLTIAWLGVLLVGIFGGNIETHGADGSASSFPVVVVVAIAALLATISIGRWAFGPVRDGGGTAGSDR